ncbi:MAG: hypothetical protein AAGF12_37055 [Myxococcota bacterium]
MEKTHHVRWPSGVVPRSLLGGAVLACAAAVLVPSLAFGQDEPEPSKIEWLFDSEPVPESLAHLSTDATPEPSPAEPSPAIQKTSSAIIASETHLALSTPEPTAPEEAPLGFGLVIQGTGFGSDGLSLGGGGFGARVRPGLGHIGFDFTMGMSGGGIRGADSGFLGFDIGTDFRFYLNPDSPVQFFAVAGAGIGFGGIAVDETSGSMSDHELCPDDGPGMFFADLSAGLGLELAFDDFIAFFADVRLRSRHALSGDLRFMEEVENVGLSETSSVVGFGGTAGVVLYLDESAFDE